MIVAHSELPCEKVRSFSNANRKRKKKKCRKPSNKLRDEHSG